MTISQRQLLLLIEISEWSEGLPLKRAATHYFSTYRSLNDRGWVRVHKSRLLLTKQGEKAHYRLTNTNILEELRIRKPVDRERVSQMRKIA